MKKRLLSVLLLAAMVMTMIVQPVQVAKAADDPAITGINAPIDFASSTTQVCPKCGGAAKEWKPLPKITEESTLTTGHYYIPAGGVTNSARYNFSGAQKVCLHLNGNTLSSNTIVFNAGNSGVLNIFGSGTVQATTKTTTGSVFYMSTCTINLYGGTYLMPNATTGCPVRLDLAGAKLNMYPGATITSPARVVRIYKGTFTMEGGTINAGKRTDASGVGIYMDAGKLVMKGGTITGGDASNYGGNVYVGAATFDMQGGTISNGKAGKSGGNVYVSNDAVKFTMTGGTISGGYAAENGGNIGAATNTLSVGGKVLNGVAGSSGGNISVGTGSTLTVSGTVAGGSLEGTGGGDWGGNIRAWQATVNIEAGAMIYGGSGGGKPGAANIGVLGEDAGAAAVLNLNGGTVTGDIYTSAPVMTDGETVFPGTTVNITGAPNIVCSVTVDGVTYSASRQGLFLQDGVKIDVSGMTGGMVYLSGNNGQAMTVAAENTALIDGCFYAYNTNQQVELRDGVFYLAERQNAPVTFAPWENDGKAYCPVCKEEKTWTATSGSGYIGEKADGTHLYLSTNHDGTGRNQVMSAAKNATVCFNLNGKTLTMDGRISVAQAGGVINIMDTSADATGLVTTTGNRTESNLYNYAIEIQQEGQINLYGGTYRNTNASFAVAHTRVVGAEINIYDGAVIDGSNTCRGIYILKGTVNLLGGTIKNGTWAEGSGGNIYMEDGSLNIKAGKVMGGVATKGGNIYIAGGSAKITDDGDANTNAPQIVGGTATTGNGGSIYSAVALTVEAGTVSAGTATAGNGGNIYCVGNLNLSNCTISGGKATGGNGGNIAVAGTSSSAKAICTFGDGALITEGSAKNAGNISLSNATVDLTAATVSAGTATGRSGNIEVGGASTLNIKGGLIDGGTAALNGGNVYTSSTTSRVTMTGGTVSNGTANNSASYTGGGNFYINNGYLTVNGGVISGGKAPKGNGGNINCRTGMNNASNKIVINDDGNPETPKPLITGGVSKNTGGNIYINGDRYEDQWAFITLGDCEITNGDAVNYSYGDDISLQHSGRLTLLSDFSAVVDIYIPDCCLPAVRAGGKIDETAIITQGTFPGKLMLEQTAEKYQLVGKQGDTCAYICDSGIQNPDGSYTWITDNSDILEAAKNQNDVILHAAPGEMMLDGGNYVVDLRGNTVHFTGTGTVTLIDSSNDSYETFGSATAVPGVTVETGMSTIGEKQYYVLCQDGVYSSHRIDYRLIRVSLRPSIGGIYFTGKWECDQILASHIDNFGVAVSALEAPQNGFANDGHSMWSFFDKSEFQNGVEKTGVMISGILKDTNADRISLNSQYAQIPVHAVAYITVDGVSSVGPGLSYSLHNVLSVIDDNIEKYASKAAAVQNFVNSWRDKGLSDDAWNMEFKPSEDAIHLNELYAGRVPFHGEFHDHADTGGKSDGKASLPKIKEYMAARDIDFTTVLDHYQILHMELDDWDSKLFIGGSEFGTIIHDKKITGNKPHVNMLFSSPEEFKELMALHNPDGKYTGGKFTFHLDEASGNEYYDEHQWSVAEFTQLIEDIRTCGGMYVFPHPKDGTRYISDDPLDYWFADWVGLEVFYGPSYYAPTNARTVNAYKLWRDLLSAGKKVWATAGSDSHNVPNTHALTTIYSTEKNAVEHFEHAKQGDMTCGPIGIRMAIGDTITGGETSFAGKRLVVCVSDFHKSVYFEGHTYSAQIIAGKGGTETVIHEQVIDPEKPFYYGMDADNSCDYYRVVVFDNDDTRITTGMPSAIGNPIWNVK